MHFIAEDDDRSRIPVAIVSGFLGSGKTTLINAVLKDARFANTAVAINEFGEIPIDQHLIDHGDDQTIVMANGCLCCNLAGDMEDAIMRVFSRSQQGEMPSFERLIIEPSGLSDPAPIAQAILRHPILSRAFCLHPLVVVVDASLMASQLARFSEMRKQVELADTIIVTKTDLVADSIVAECLHDLAKLNPRASLHKASHGGIDPDQIFARSFYDASTSIHPIAEMLRASGLSSENPVKETPHEHAHHAASHDDISSVALVSDQPLPWKPLEQWLRRVRIESGERLLRMKGLANLQGQSRPVVIQTVEHVQSVPVELERWPDQDHRSRFVLIGKELDFRGIVDSWQQLCQSSIDANAATPAAHSNV